MTDIHHSAEGPLTTEGIEDTVIDAAPGSPGQASPAPPSRAKRILKTAGWVAFALACLVTFTLIKLPEDRLKNYVQGMISAQLAPQGIGFAAERGRISIGWGVSYVMTGVTLTFPEGAAPSKIDKVSFTPSLLPMALGYRGGTFWVYQGGGTLHASFSAKGSQVSGSFKADAIDLGKIGALPALAGVRGGMLATGNGAFSGDSAVPSSMTADIDLALGKIVLEQQSLAGFAVPRIQVSEGKIELSAGAGKATIKTLKLGKAGNASDDLQATATGDAILGRTWETSTLNSRVSLKLSEGLQKAFVLIDAFLGPGKQPDGSYLFTLSGPLLSPQPTPIKPGS